MKDFFDEEFEKKQEQQQRIQQEKLRQVNDWSSATPQNGGTASAPKRALYISLICIAIVLAIVMGWVLCAVFGGNRSVEERLLSKAMDYLDSQFYQDISDAQKVKALEAAGTAYLRTAGDRYCQLMSPQTFYEEYMPVSDTQANSGKVSFGFSYAFYNIGLYVGEALTDGSCYGILQGDDIILKFTEMQNVDGEAVSVEGLGEFSEFNVADHSEEDCIKVLAATHSTNMVVLRDGEIFHTGKIMRGKVGFDAENPKSKYQFVEYYFNQNDNNISTENINLAQHNTYELRGLNNLPADTGYIRLTQFMYYTSGEREVTAHEEFWNVMQKFRTSGLKRLVLDLKGNPGGRVDVVCNIAGMLITDEKLPSADQQKLKKVVVEDGKSVVKYKITSLVPKKESKKEEYYFASSYSAYFGTPGEICDIVLWTDGNSASASELLTGALVDYQTAFQIGATTYGKGIAQNIVPLQNYTGPVTPLPGRDETSWYWAIKYTYASYYSPLGTNIHGKGYSPQEGYCNITEYGNKSDTSTLWGATYKYWNIH